MCKILILACFVVFIHSALCKPHNITEKMGTNLSENKTIFKPIVVKAITNILNRSETSTKSEKEYSDPHLKSVNEQHINNASNLENNQRTSEEQKSLPILHKIHARITRSKDAVWATITLTFMCVLLVLAVAQSRMWKDHYYTEAQGIPLPNFNERVLFKDVMEHKVKSLKKFFKKKSKEKNITELESLLPPSEWDT